MGLSRPRGVWLLVGAATALGAAEPALYGGRPLSAWLEQLRAASPEARLQAAVALLSSLVAGYFPARAAARLHPVDIIRGAT